MKKIFIPVLLISNLSVFSQPTLLSSEMAAPGTIFIYKHVGAFTAIDTSIQGANQSWDFSTVPTTSDPDYINTIINPSLTPFADTFPTANWGILENPDDYSFFNLSSSSLERLGSYNPMDGYTYYTNTQVEYLFPMSLGVNNSDPSTNVNAGTTSNTLYTFNCIGYGTLMAPGHTYNNVIMTRVELDLSIFNVVAYIWYDSDNGMPVFDYVPGDGFFISESAIYLNSVTTGIKDKSFASGIQINNPVSTILKISLYNEFAWRSYHIRHC
jgi:hypothetical protein